MIPLYLSPTAINALYGTGNYQFSLVKFPEITFMVQSVEVPAITLGVSTISSSVHDYPVPGEHLSYDDLTCTFIVDQKLNNFSAIYSWMYGMGFPKNHQLYADLMASSKNAASLTELSKGYTDGVLNILGNDNLPIMQLHLIDCFPTRLSGLQFDSSNSDSSALTATVTFAYSYYDLRLPT